LESLSASKKGGKSKVAEKTPKKTAKPGSNLRNDPSESASPKRGFQTIIAIKRNKQKPVI